VATPLINGTTGALSRSVVALGHVPRFDAGCPPSPAADPQTTAINAGTFITATFMSGRLPSAS
jgi:hypothetical protein